MTGMYVKDGGVWKPVTNPQVKDGGVWKPIKSGYVKDAGSWKQFFNSSIDYTYIGTLGNSGSLTTYTLTPFSFTPNSFVVVVLGIFENVHGGQLPSGVTIGGVSATLISGATTNATYDGSVAIYSAQLGASPTSDVVATFTLGADGITASAITFNLNSTVSDASPLVSGVITSINTTLNTPDSGITIAAGYRRLTSGGGTITGSGPFTELFEGVINQSVTATVAIKNDGVARTGEVITYTPTASDRIVMVAASWGP